ncbi:hypothetical protein [Methylobacterium sp. SyP6R]|uniref:hypothetical protein n=1 Tax=Methylobacterium sp. SyP6R TaxID=2718876 RepID=UPI001F31251D|nr:hypothetical protein [Methylobacterium sp. SyP6R]MCF4124996.1 hypothetical protein [Methylobacterium sp. SyP6R]
MTKAPRRIARKRQQIANPATSKAPCTSVPARRTRKTHPPEGPGAFGRPTRATVAARADLRGWLADGTLQRVDALMMASLLLAAAVREARAFLDPMSLTMALAAIGTVPERVTGENLDAKVQSILMGVAESEL